VDRVVRFVRRLLRFVLERQLQPSLRPHRQPEHALKSILWNGQPVHDEPAVGSAGELHVRRRRVVADLAAKIELNARPPGAAPAKEMKVDVGLARFQASGRPSSEMALAPVSLNAFRP
jgi:hypothetical protein